jgi:broad specificity phosphatase PhoE
VNALIHLVRHASHAQLGHVLSGRSEIGLSTEGRVQAARVASLLASRAPRAIHSSPRRRARETAQALASSLKLEMRIVDALDEIDFGKWTGVSFATLAKDPAWDRWNQARSRAAPPGGETMSRAVARLVDHVERSASEDDGPFVFVSHCDLIRGVIAYYLGLPLNRMLGFDCDPASVSTLSVGDWGGRVVSVNERAG